MHHWMMGSEKVAATHIHGFYFSPSLATLAAGEVAAHSNFTLIVFLTCTQVDCFLNFLQRIETTITACHSLESAWSFLESMVMQKQFQKVCVVI